MIGNGFRNGSRNEQECNPEWIPKWIPNGSPNGFRNESRMDTKIDPGMGPEWIPNWIPNWIQNWSRHGSQNQFHLYPFRDIFLGPVVLLLGSIRDSNCIYSPIHFVSILDSFWDQFQDLFSIISNSYWDTFRDTFWDEFRIRSWIPYYIRNWYDNGSHSIHFPFEMNTILDALIPGFWMNPGIHYDKSRDAILIHSGIHSWSI